MDDTGNLLTNKLTEKIHADQKSIDLPHWFQNYAFDTVGSMCYSKLYGFIERDVDVDGIISTTRMILDYTAHVRPQLSSRPRPPGFVLTPEVWEYPFHRLAVA